MNGSRAVTSDPVLASSHWLRNNELRWSLTRPELTSRSQNVVSKSRQYVWCTQLQPPGREAPAAGHEVLDPVSGAQCRAARVERFENLLRVLVGGELDDHQLELVQQDVGQGVPTPEGVYLTHPRRDPSAEVGAGRRHLGLRLHERRVLNRRDGRPGHPPPGGRSARPPAVRSWRGGPSMGAA